MDTMIHSSGTHVIKKQKKKTKTKFMCNAFPLGAFYFYFFPFGWKILIFSLMQCYIGKVMRFFKGQFWIYTSLKLITYRDWYYLKPSTRNGWILNVLQLHVRIIFCLLCKSIVGMQLYIVVLLKRFIGLHNWCLCTGGVWLTDGKMH